MSKTSDNIGKRFKEAREYMKMSTRYVSDKTGVDHASVSRTERAKQQLSSTQFIAIADFYGLSLDDIARTAIVRNAKGQVV